MVELPKINKLTLMSAVVVSGISLFQSRASGTEYLYVASRTIVGSAVNFTLTSPIPTSVRKVYLSFNASDMVGGSGNWKYVIKAGGAVISTPYALVSEPYKSENYVTINLSNGGAGTSLVFTPLFTSFTMTNLLVSSVSLPEAQASIQNTASALQGTFALQNSVVANGLDYDCQIFDKDNICISGGARNTAVNAGGLNNFSALLVAAYRAMPELRLGAYLDQNLSVNNGSSPVNLGVGAPLFGLFGVWNANTDGTGTEVRVSAAYGQKSVTITRAVVGASEAAIGTSSLNNTAVQAIVKYGFAIDKDAMVSPYIGIRYNQGNMAGYTEASSAAVTTPLTYAALNTNATTFMAGVHGKYRVVPEAVVQASVGLESDMSVNNGTLTATGLTGLTAVNFNPNPVKTRPVAMLGAYYDIEKNQRVGVTGIWRQEPFQAVGSATVMATYTVGL
jgi:hypothetical protein